MKRLQFYQAVIIEFTNLIVITERPKDLACRTIVEILRESKTAVIFNDLTDKAYDRNIQIADYIGNVRYIEGNRKLRAIRDMLLQDSRIMQVQDKPIALKWVGILADFEKKRRLERGEWDIRPISQNFEPTRPFGHGISNPTPYQVSSCSRRSRRPPRTFWTV